MDLETQQRTLLTSVAVGFGLNIVAGLAVFFVTKSAISTLATIAVTELLLVLFMARALLVHPRIPGITQYSRSSPVGGDLLAIGDMVTTEFVFWGISAKTVIHSDDFRRIIIERARGSTTFRFLILHPTSPHLAVKALEEGDTATGWRREIEANIDRLREMRDEHHLNIEVRTYDAWPIFRLMFINSSTLYFGWYPRGSQGVHSPLIVVRNDRISIYHPIRLLFEQVWDNSANAL